MVSGSHLESLDVAGDVFRERRLLGEDLLLADPVSVFQPLEKMAPSLAPDL